MEYRNNCLDCGKMLVYEQEYLKCCNRDSFNAITKATICLYEEFNVKLQSSEKITCGFSRYNNECIKNDCAFHN
ncbi:MAG: hypothetical protein A2W91_04720 [Bacteroidetes bacterium GWF2_38_335]|nr:MAG: hypothetical protein A2W91_04720 [Bacteroidetes bacterium GWF2_38_335]OFY80029.1 MAG: hypothetical protein A2281_12135 [Bacteroidetes bacterium RIFOXYA12_FULL_38_20]HBS85235.1 hypothetical protein [Bacteroidales bacterium]